MSIGAHERGESCHLANQNGARGHAVLTLCFTEVCSSVRQEHIHTFLCTAGLYNISRCAPGELQIDQQNAVALLPYCTVLYCTVPIASLPEPRWH